MSDLFVPLPLLLVFALDIAAAVLVSYLSPRVALAVWIDGSSNVHGVIGAVLGLLVEGARLLLLMLVTSSLDFRPFSSDIVGFAMNLRAFNIPLLVGIGFFAGMSASTLVRRSVVTDLQRFLALLQSDSDSDRRYALREFRRLADSSAIPAVLPLLDDAEPSVRREAVETLERIGGQQAVEPLTRLLADPDAAVRSDVEDALRQIGGQENVRAIQDRRVADTLGDPGITEIGILFDIDALGGGYYGYSAYRILFDALDPKRLANCTLLDGDTAETLARHARHYCIAIRARDASTIDYVRSTVGARRDMGLLTGEQRFAVDPTNSNMLTVAGMVDLQGDLVVDSSSPIGSGWVENTAWNVVKRESAVPVQLAVSGTTSRDQAPQRDPGSFLGRDSTRIIVLASVMGVIAFTIVMFSTDFKRENTQNVHSGATQLAKPTARNTEKISVPHAQPSAPRFRAGCAHFVHAYIIGGLAADAQILSTVERYDIVDQNWLRDENLRTPRCAFATVNPLGSVYVLGGRNQTEALDSVEALDLSTRPSRWNAQPAMPVARWSHMSTLAGNRIFVLGGLLGVGPDRSVTDRVDTFDLNSRVWSRGSPLPTPRHDAAVVSDATTNDKIYVIGGRTGPSEVDPATSSVDRFDVKTGTWTSLAPLPQPVAGSQAFVDPKRIFVAGGSNEAAATDLIQVYSIESDSWETPKHLATGRVGHCMASEDDHQVMIVGGARQSPPLDFVTSVEILRY